MIRCKNCSAPLQNTICDYCGSRNNIDLVSFKPVDVNAKSERLCPVCRKNMLTIDVGMESPLLIERCESCYGLFFDKDELEPMIDQNVKGITNVDMEKLKFLAGHPRHNDDVVYRRCPVCRKHMHRKNYGLRSGVITDVCLKHGVWLDAGELRHILEWVKVGGLAHPQNVRETKTFYSQRDRIKKLEAKMYPFSRRKRYFKSLNDVDAMMGFFSL